MAGSPDRGPGSRFLCLYAAGGAAKDKDLPLYGKKYANLAIKNGTDRRNSGKTTVGIFPRKC